MRQTKGQKTVPITNSCSERNTDNYVLQGRTIRGKPLTELMAIRNALTSLRRIWFRRLRPIVTTQYPAVAIAATNPVITASDWHQPLGLLHPTVPGIRGRLNPPIMMPTPSITRMILLFMTGSHEIFSLLSPLLGIIREHRLLCVILSLRVWSLRLCRLSGLGGRRRGRS